MKVALISSWHVHAKDYAKQIQEMPNCEIVAVWDENKESGLKWASSLACPFIDDYDELLKEPSIDGVVINSPTVMHTDLIIKAANAKKHIFTEKVLAIRYADCPAIQEAVTSNQVNFTISYVHKSRPEMIMAKELVDSGSLGQITYARVRNAHNGSTGNWLPETFYDLETCGGGAMIDLGAHTGYLLEWLLGPIQEVTATFTQVTGKGVEDNAVALLSFDKGAIGVAETSFVTVYTPLTLEVSGTKGTLLVRDGLTYATEETEGKWIRPSELPESKPSPLAQWVNAFETKTSVNPDFGIDAAVALTRLMDGMYASNQKGIKIQL